jgi:RimJ/RimL family protein N-acetyltransferase
MRYVFGNLNLNLNKVWTELYSFDERKITMFSRMGLKRDAVVRDNCFEDGRFHDSYIYSLLRADPMPEVEP